VAAAAGQTHALPFLAAWDAVPWQAAYVAAEGTMGAVTLRQVLQLAAGPAALHRLLHAQGRLGTALHVAAAMNDADCATALLAAGAPLRARNAHGLRAIHVAAAAGAQEVMWLLEAAGSQLSAEVMVLRDGSVGPVPAPRRTMPAAPAPPEDPIVPRPQWRRHARERRLRGLHQWRLQQATRRQTGDASLLWYAVSGHALAVVDDLLARGAAVATAGEPFFGGASPLAQLGMHPSRLRKQLQLMHSERGLWRLSSYISRLRAIGQQRNMDAQAELTMGVAGGGRAGSGPRPKPPSLFSFSADASSAAMLKLLLAWGADPNTLFPGETPLVACLRGEVTGIVSASTVQRVRALLAAGGDASVIAPFGQDALSVLAAQLLAMDTAAKEMTLLLVEAGAPLQPATVERLRHLCLTTPQSPVGGDHGAGGGTVAVLAAAGAVAVGAAVGWLAGSLVGRVAGLVGAARPQPALPPVPVPAPLSLPRPGSFWGAHTAFAEQLVAAAAWAKRRHLLQLRRVMQNGREREARARAAHTSASHTVLAMAAAPQQSGAAPGDRDGASDR
jgi:hypothetical protein